MAFLSDLHPIFWGTYLLCMLLPLALFALLAPGFWREHYGKLSVIWGLAFTVFCVAAFPEHPYIVQFSSGRPVQSPIDLAGLLHFLLFSYLPAVLMFFALLATGGGIRLSGELAGTPRLNAALLAAGGALSCLFGGFAAFALLIRPLFQANAHRRYRVHSVVFFLLITLSCSGRFFYFPVFLFDPVTHFASLGSADFFGLGSAVAASMLLAYFLLESYLFKKEGFPVQPGPAGRLGLKGGGSPFLLPAIAVALLIPAVWRSGATVDVYARQLDLADIISYALMLAIAIAASLKARHRAP